ncbi:MAG: hypothetical protein JWM78_1905 [Verrucomicrobiaceae bacterium]|nr:hypothetical protein [Verrucomicrobiaceae bacterium]
MRKPLALPQLTLLAGLAAVIAMALYLTLFWESNPPTLSLSPTVDPDHIDLYAEQVHGVKYGPDGRVVQTLTATKMDHYPASGASILQQPVLLSLGKDGKLWNTTAVTGVLISDNEIQLHDNVVVVDADKTTRFETEVLTYFQDEQKATTDVPVKLIRSGDTTTAIGMRAYLARDRVELLNRVNSIHAQP